MKMDKEKRLCKTWFGRYINVYLVVGLCILLPILIITVFAEFFAPYDPTYVFMGEYLQAPSQKHPLGTDSLGMDVFSRLLYAPRTDIMIGVSASLLGFAIGVPLGLYAGYFESKQGINGMVSTILMRIMDVIQAFPIFILGLSIVAITGQKVANVTFVLAFIWIPVFVRLVRTEVLRLRENLFVMQEQAIGQKNSVIMFKHILPNAISSSITQISTCMAASILLTAGLSFVGAGVRMPQPELGLMISVGSGNMITGQWWPALFPGLMLCFIVFSLSIIGEGTTIIIDPRNWG